MDYNFIEIEKKWQQYWRDHKVYKVDIDHNKPKFYVLDMFPYPSGQACMWDTRWVISPPISMRVTSV